MNLYTHKEHKTEPEDFIYVYLYVHTNTQQHAIKSKEAIFLREGHLGGFEVRYLAFYEDIQLRKWISRHYQRHSSTLTRADRD